MSFVRPLLLLFLLLTASSAFAQSDAIVPTRASLDVGYQFGPPLSFDRKSGKLVHFGSSKTGISKDNGGYAGASMSYRLSDPWDLTLGFHLASGKGEFKSDIFSVADTQQMDFTIATNHAELDFSVMAGVEVAPWLRLIAGTSLSIFVRNEAVQTRRLLMVDGVSRDETDTVASGDDINGKPVHVWLPAGVRIPLILTDGTVFGTDIMGALNLTEGLRGHWSQAWRVRAGLWLAVYGWKQEPIAVSTMLVGKLENTARFVVNGDLRDSVKITTIDTIITTSNSLPQTIYFDEGRSSITQHDQLPDAQDAIEVLMHRARASQGSVQIELHKNASELTSTEQERMSLFRSVLSGLGERLQVSGNRTTKELSHAVLRSSDPSFLMPSRTRITKREHRIEHLSIHRYTQSEAGLKEWGTVIYSGTDTLLRFSHETLQVAEWEHQDFRAPANTDRIFLQSFAIDRLDQRSDSYDTLYITQDSGAKRFVTIDEYLLVNQPAPPGQAYSFDAALIDAMVRSVTPNTIIEVSNVLNNGLDDVTQTISKIMDGCRARGVLPAKIEAKPHTETRAVPPSINATFGNAVRVRAINAEK